MNKGRGQGRPGHSHRDQTIILALIVIVCIAALRWLVPEQPDNRPLWDRLVAAVVGLVQCFGLFVGASLLVASLELIKQTASRYRQRRTEQNLDRLRPLLHDTQGQATRETLARVVRLLRERDPSVRERALAVTWCLLRAEPALASASAYPRSLVESALLQEPGFARTLASVPGHFPTLDLVTLGAKVGAGTADKRIAPVTSDPAVLARWLYRHRDPDELQEVQVSIGYDTGSLPYLSERARFIALYLYITSTDLKAFQALTRRPTRDPSAAFGLLIRGDVVEVRFPGQARGRRLDYVFPFPSALTEGSLVDFLRIIQLINLGLLCAVVDDTARILLPPQGRPDQLPAWLHPRTRAVARAYRLFERRFLALLRRHDRHREPEKLHVLDPADHAERVRALLQYRLEECLYPQHAWVVPLYSLDDRWDSLLPFLRAVEGMMLHQGEAEDRDSTRGLEFIQQVRLLGEEAATRIETALSGATGGAGLEKVLLDPFLDVGDEEASQSYLRRAAKAVSQGDLAPEDLPDPATFRRALTYYHLDGLHSLTPSTHDPAPGLEEEPPGTC